MTWWSGKTVRDLSLKTPVTVTSGVNCGAAISIMQDQGFDMLPVLDATGELKGVVTASSISAKLTSGRLGSQDSIDNAMFKGFRKIFGSTTLAELSAAFDMHHFAICVDEQKTYTGDGSASFTTSSFVSGVVTRIDLLAFINKGE